MTYERDGLLLPEATKQPIDYDLNQSLEVALGGPRETYQELALTPEKKQKVLEAWHNGQNADLSAEHLDLEALDAKLATLKAWKQDLIANKAIDPDIKELYRWKINEHIANVYMLIASTKGDAEGFKRWNEFIYGPVDETIYRGALDWIAHDAEKILTTPDQPVVVTGAAQKVLTQLEGKRGYREILAPDEKTFELVRNDHMSEMGYYTLILAGVEVPNTPKISNEIGDPILLKALENIGSPKSLVNAEGATWSVTKRGFERPETYDFIRNRFIGLGIGHESSHELERINGSRGPLALLKEGLDRYELGNEGRGLIREEVVYENFEAFGSIVRWRDVLRRDIAIGYANGVGEDRPKTSLEVYQFVNMIDTMYQAKLEGAQAKKNGTVYDEAKVHLAAQKKSDDLVVRVLKGTDGEGGAFAKDKSYLEGHVADWLVTALEGPQAISNGDVGKYNISEPRHIKKLQKLGILPTGE